MPSVEQIRKAASEALETMFRSSIEQPAKPTDFDGISHAYRLEFRGDVNGDFVLGMTRQSAFALAANFLGEDAGKLSEAIVDQVLGELTNMVAGCVLSKVEAGGTFTVTDPVAGDAEELSRELQTGEAHAFELDEGFVAVRMRM